MNRLLSLGIYCLLFSCTPQLHGQSDHGVFEKAYEHYIHQEYEQSILLLEGHLQQCNKSGLKKSLNPSHFLQLSQRDFNQGLLLLLQLKLNPDLPIFKKMLLFSPTELSHCFGNESRTAFWQKAHKTLVNKDSLPLLQKIIAKGFMLAGMTAIHINQTEQASLYFKKALEFDQYNQETLLGLALVKFDEGQAEAALLMLKEFADKFPDNHLVNLCEAEIYLSLQYYDRAAKSLDVFLGHLPNEQQLLTFNHYDLLMKNGQTKMFLRNYAVAEGCFSQAIEVNDASVEAFIARAEARAYILKLKEAEEDLFIARSLDSENSHVFHMLGYVKMLQWQNEEALSYFSKAIDLQGDIKEAYIHRSSVKSVLGDIEGAIEDLDQVIRMDDNADKSYAVRAYLKSRKGDIKGALSDYNQAIVLAPNNASHFIGRAAVKEQLEMEESYLDDLDRAITLNPKNYYPYHAKGAWYQRKKENDKALEAYNQAIKVAPDVADIYIDRGSIYLAKGNPKGALQDLDTVISLEPKNGQAYFLQGILYFLLEKNLKACASMYKAKSLGFEEAEESLVSLCGK
ncbi:MAG: tetratricopeptide repeat protein [Chitinophagales bacterium]